MIERQSPARLLSVTLLILGVAACATVPATAPPPNAPTAGPMASAYGKPRPLIGADAKRLIQMFGQPRLDIRDRSVRKLQFANGRCILDAYLYSSAKGKDPLVTYVDSRLPNGSDTDPQACAAILAVK